MKYDHLDPGELWDLVYDTAKNKKKRRRLWRELMSPDYADLIIQIADTHIKRIDDDLSSIAQTGESTIPGDVEGKKKARAFISSIRGSAINIVETGIRMKKNVRKYERISDLLDYQKYLKDCIEDLRYELEEENIDFPFCSTLESYKNGKEVQLDDWIYSRSLRE